MEKQRRGGCMSRLRKSVITKIFLLILLLVLPLSIMLVYVTYDSMKIMEKHTVDAIESTLNIFMAQLERDMNAMDKYLSRMGNDTFFMQMVQKKNENKYTLAKINLNREFNEQIIVNPRTAGVFYYKDGQDMLLNINVSFLSEKEKLENTLIDNMYDRKSRWKIIRIEEEYFLVDIMNQGDAFLGGLMSINEILKEIEDSFSYERMAFFLEEKPQKSENGYVAVISKSKLYGVELVLSMLLPKKEITEQLPIIQKRNYYMSLLLLMVTPLILVILKRIVLVPMKRINMAMEMVKKEKTDYRIPEYRTSYGFQNINHTFNSMMDQIMCLKIDNYERKLEKKKIELSNLQLQIRPHFLLNSFNLLFNLAQMKDFEKIQEMIICLVTYYRKSMCGVEDVRRVNDEIMFIENYLELANIRYRNSFEINIDVDENLKNERIPTFLIYTFVENSISHGLKIGEKISIHISVAEKNQKIEIVVEDNGNGIPPEVLEEISRGDMVHKEEEEHIGLWNCRKRLEYQYGEEATMVVESKYGEGSKVTVIIPKLILDEGKKES